MSEEKSEAKFVSFKSAAEVRDGVVAQSPYGDLIVLARDRIALKRSGGVFRPMFRGQKLPGSLDEWDDIEVMALRWKLFKEADGVKALQPPVDLEPAIAHIEQTKQRIDAVMNAFLVRSDQERANRKYPKFQIDPSRMHPGSNSKIAYLLLLFLLVFLMTSFLGDWLD